MKSHQQLNMTHQGPCPQQRHVSSSLRRAQGGEVGGDPEHGSLGLGLLCRRCHFLVSAGQTLANINNSLDGLLISNFSLYAQMNLFEIL